MHTIIKNNLLEYSISEDGIGTITIDQIDQTGNWYSFNFVNNYIQAATQAIADENVKGVIVTSKKKMFMPGGDLNWLVKPIEDNTEFFNNLMKIHRGLRAIETSGKPFVAAINGTALGGGMELCLSCHYRIVLNDPNTLLGLPESSLGLLPGSGGTAKLPYLLGLENAFLYLLQGTKVGPNKAVEDGLVNASANSTEEMFTSAKKYINEHPKPIQPWDDPNYKIPGGGLTTLEGWQLLMKTTGNLRQATHGNYPASEYILSIIHDGLNLPIDRALEIEARYATKTCQTKEAKNMIRTGFFGIQKARNGKFRPKDEPFLTINSLGIFSSDTIANEIAYLSAKTGIEVLMNDVSIENGKKSSNYFKSLSEKKGVNKEKMDAILKRITFSNNIKAIHDCDLLIEDFHCDKIKNDPITNHGKILNFKVSDFDKSHQTGIIQEMNDFVGLHFFSPTDNKDLIEIIVNEQTSQKVISAAIDFIVSINKVPLLVNENLDLFVSRCEATFYSEAIFLLEEGVPATMIENIAKQKGMAESPLSAIDKAGLDRYMEFFKNILASGTKLDTRLFNLFKLLVEKHGRLGEKNKKGFYDYPEFGKKELWFGLTKIFHSKNEKMNKDVIANRIMHRQALESYRCLDEGVINTVTDGDIGSVVGWGFPLYTGGAISYIDYIGVNKFINDCQNFELIYGKRWEVPDSLKKLAATNKSVLDFKYNIL